MLAAAGHATWIPSSGWPSMLKIDRAFIATMSTNNDDKDVVQTVVALAHTLRMQVTVEGVETDELAASSSAATTRRDVASRRR